MPKVTLQDIASVCEMDISTVSRAMRGDPRVTSSTRKRIKEAAERLGYRPNLLARNLAGGKTNTVWIIIPSLDASMDYRMVKHASHHANSRDYTLFAALHDCDNFGALKGHSIEHYTQMIEQAGQGLADGAIILPRRHVNDVTLLGDLVRQKFPLVFVDNYVEELPVPVVTTDNKKGAHELARRCVEAGAERAILLFEEPNPVARARLAGAQAALRELGIPFVDITRAPGSWSPGNSTAPLAILGSNQGYLHQFAVQHADHLRTTSVIFGVFDEWTGEPAPAEKVIIAVQDSETVADRAVDRLINLIEKNPLEGPRIDLVPILEFKMITASFFPAART